jgi:hypothetical protein
MHAFLLLLGDALAQAPQGPPASAAVASTWLNTITACITALGILATAALSILKMLDKAKIRVLEKERAVLTEVVTAIGEAVDEVKPILSSSDAKEVTGAIQRHAIAKGVLLPLDTLLADKGLNQADREQLGQSPPAPQPGQPG